MRKIAVFLLCLMLITMPALAEVYTSNTGLFTYECPEDCISFTGDYLSAMLNGDMSDYIEEEMGNLGFEGATYEELYEELKNMDLSDMDLIYASDFAGNVNMYAQKDIGLTADMLPLLVDALDAQMVELYKSMGAPEAGIQSQGIQTIGENQYYVIYVEMSSEWTLHQYMTFNENGDQIVITFTSFPQDKEIALMESIKLL